MSVLSILSVNAWASIPNWIVPYFSRHKILDDKMLEQKIVEIGRRAVLPEHDRNAACAETYRAILSFVQAAPERARSLAQTILDVLEWFRQFEQNPSLALSRGS